MNKFLVKPIKIALQSNLYDYKDSYTLRTDKRFVWLQKFAIYILRKLGAYNFSTDVTVRTVDFTQQEFNGKMIEYISNIVQNYNFTPRIILIGREHIEDLFKIQIDQPVNVSGKYYDYHTKQYLGLDVYIVPWMEGIVALPDYGQFRNFKFE